MVSWGAKDRLCVHLGTWDPMWTNPNIIISTVCRMWSWVIANKTKRLPCRPPIPGAFPNALVTWSFHTWLVALFTQQPLRPWLLRSLGFSLVESVTRPRFGFTWGQVWTIKVHNIFNGWMIYMESHFASTPNVGWDCRGLFKSHDLMPSSRHQGGVLKNLKLLVKFFLHIFEWQHVWMSNMYWNIIWHNTIQFKYVHVTIWNFKFGVHMLIPKVVKFHCPSPDKAYIYNNSKPCD
jgi:hypothetical protein